MMMLKDIPRLNFAFIHKLFRQLHRIIYGCLPIAALADFNRDALSISCTAAAVSGVQAISIVGIT